MWHKIAKKSDFKDRTSQLVEINGKPIALFKANGSFFAIDNTCPHRGAPLADGYLEGTKVTCSWHAWVFDVQTGACDNPVQENIPTYKIKVEGDDIFLFA